ncbi:Hsp20 family protein [Candidatus Micrarchaeota archaeon]|nr:Hsp20 family protein [Candidatus Micrarchaeota archaeon]MBD3417570.1 Hsp20 family protein [Candidatus Micrarchaeota archaeon]
MSDENKKKRRGFFNFLGGGNSELFENIDEMFERMREEMEDEMEKMRGFRVQLDEGQLRKMSQNPNVKVYGYSMRVGPDGKPQFREFGNVKPQEKGPTMQEGSESREKEQETGGREPLIDMFTSKGKTTVVAELPGVSEKDINVTLKGKKLEIKVGKGERKYYKELELPKKFTKKKMKQKYNNGVLELTFS